MNPPIPRWFQAPAGTTLFHVTKDPLEPSEFEEIVNSDGEVISRWGRSSTIEVRHAYFLVLRSSASLLGISPPVV